MLAAMKLGAVVDPGDDAADARRPRRPLRARPRAPRHRRRRRGGEIRATCPATTRASPSAATPQAGSATRTRYDAAAAFTPDGETRATDPLLLYFTSGTTAKPKLVLHTPPELSGRPSLDDVLDRAADRATCTSTSRSPGWAKHAWSCFFAPWNAGACVFMLQPAALRRAGACSTRSCAAGVTTLCAPPTVWRMLIQRRPRRVAGRSCARWSAPASRSIPRSSSGCKRAWGLTIRDGYGQTETTAQVGNLARASRVKPGVDGPAAARLSRRAARQRRHRARRRARSACRSIRRPLGLMEGYQGDDGALRPRRRRRLLPHRRRRRCATPTATSPTSAAPTTCSKRPTIASARSSWRAR